VCQRKFLKHQNIFVQMSIVLGPLKNKKYNQPFQHKISGQISPVHIEVVCLISAVHLLFSVIIVLPLDTASPHYFIIILTNSSGWYISLALLNIKYFNEQIIPIECRQ
jgi:hypothetical protein